MDLESFGCVTTGAFRVFL